MNNEHIFERGQGDWDKLCDFIDNNNFSTLDALALVCAHLVAYKQKHFDTRLMAGGVEFDIKITKKD